MLSPACETSRALISSRPHLSANLCCYPKTNVDISLLLRIPLGSFLVFPHLSGTTCCHFSLQICIVVVYFLSGNCCQGAHGVSHYSCVPKRAVSNAFSNIRMSRKTSGPVAKLAEESPCHMCVVSQQHHCSQQAGATLSAKKFVTFFRHWEARYCSWEARNLSKNLFIQSRIVCFFSLKSLSISPSVSVLYQQEASALLR